jgi:O-acetyl-ADP-ribose deacetylase (regulator of RNase III)
MAAALARIEIVRADITTLDVDAIVNAANSRLIPGGGVDGAINKAAGPELGRAMMAIGRCATGEAVITHGFKLKAKHVIHTVAPVYAQHPELEVWRLLANCYRNALALAVAHDAQSVAFPSLGTGVYGIPIARASAVAIDAGLKYPHAARVIFCCFSESDASIYRAELDRRNG